MSPAAFSCSQRPCFHVWCVSRNGDETHQTLQQGRQALAYTGRRSLAALAVSRQCILLSSRYVAGAVVACVRSASSVSSSVAVVAAVCVQLFVSHRLVAPLSQPRNSTRLHRADTCAWSRPGASAEPLPTRQLSARFRPRTMTDSPALHPLHSISLQFRRLHFHSIAFRRPQTGETVRKKSCAPEKA